ncbi:MAG: hypothetical protein MZV63_69085 [Marinilabiliales bacterium]|nr:hypothetical protein [Marinilabiliales bacterium]
MSIKFVTGVSSGGTANENSMLYIGYSFENLSDRPVDFEFYLLVRPFQVNPYYQFLNTTGGSGKIDTISEEAGGLVAVDDKVIITTRPYDSFGAAAFDEGNIVELVRSGKMPPGRSATDRAGMANGVMKYSIHLDAGETDGILCCSPVSWQKID